MSRVYLLVEGQTEETFVKELLQPHYAQLGLFLTPIIVKTSPGYRGGVTSYAKVKPQIEKLCKQDAGAHVTTVFDLYALPNDFPGKCSAAYPTNATGRCKAKFLEAELAQDIAQSNFIPNLLVHEFEALLFSHVDAFEKWIDDAHSLQILRNTKNTTAPEDINDGPQTAPSKRILKAKPNYQKVHHGTLIACDIGLDSIRAACPHFNDWLTVIEGLVHTKVVPDGDGNASTKVGFDLV